MVDTEVMQLRKENEELRFRIVNLEVFIWILCHFKPCRRCFICNLEIKNCTVAVKGTVVQNLLTLSSPFAEKAGSGREESGHH